MYKHVYPSLSLYIYIHIYIYIYIHMYIGASPAAAPAAAPTAAPQGRPSARLGSVAVVHELVKINVGGHTERPHPQKSYLID